MRKKGSEKVDRAAMFSVPDLKDRGWTETLVKRFLGQPDATCTNPFYKSGPPMRLYALGRVTAIEATEEFAAAKSRAGYRSAVSFCVAQDKRQELLREIDAVEITVARHDIDTVRNRAIASREARQQDYPDYESSGWDATDATIERWMVNFLRHECTIYDAAIDRLFGRVGKEQAYRLLKRRTLNAIAAAYPSLKRACDDQLARI